MDCRAVLIFLCLLMSQAACTSSGRNYTRAWNNSIQLVQNNTRSVLDRLASSLYPQKAAPGVPPNIRCLSLNTTVQVRPEQQSLTADHLSCFRCHMMNISGLGLTPELSSNLRTISEQTGRMERLVRPRVNHSCHLPTFEQDVDKYEYVRSLLQLLDHMLRKPKF